VVVLLLDKDVVTLSRWTTFHRFKSVAESQLESTMISGSATRVVRGYFYWVVIASMCAWMLAGCSSVRSSSSDPPPDTTPPTAPANLTATATLATQINLSWTASTDNVGVAQYKVERCVGAGCANFAQIATPVSATFNDTGLSASTAYSYRVRATDAAGNNSAYSNVFSDTTPAASDTTPPTAPTNLVGTAASSTQIILSWTASTDNVGVTGYKVERCSGAACANFVQIAAPATTSFSDTGLTASTSYSYRVRANDAAGNNSAYSNTASATTPAPPDTTPPTAPTNLTASAPSPTQINLSWTASTDNVGVTGYKVERCSGAACANFVQIATPATTSFSDTGLTASTSYSYRVRATDAAGNLSGYSNTASATTPATPDTTPPTAPTNLTATAAPTSQINLSWTASTDNVGVTGYKVERCSGAACANFVQIATPTTTTFNDTGLTASTSYSYRVRANDAAGNNSAYSNTASATTQTPPDTTPPTAPTNLTATAASTSQISLTWTASTDNVGVTGYKVERCSGAACANFVQIATPTTTTFNDTGLTASTSYSYRVRANDAAGNNSGYSNTASATTQASSGNNISVTISPVRGGLTISQTMPFTATVTNDVGSAGVTWSASSGSFSTQSTSAATFVAPSSAGVVTVTATSVADVTKSASATIGVTDLAGVFTYHNDLSRDGVNSQEYALTTANVATATFGKLFSCATDGAMYAQPLWVANLPIQGATHNVVFAATTHDTVYAFDADANPCVKYWSASLLGNGETYVSYNDANTTDIYPDIGIIGTPVIDPSSNTLYVVSKSKTSGASCTPGNPSPCFQRLHALSLIDGSEKFGGPANITSAISVPGTGDGSSGGNLAFNTLTQNQRPGLVLSNGVVYVTWASHGDNTPYHGWVVGFNASTLAIAATLNMNPNGSDSGIWMSGGAPAADSSGNLYFLTGNGTFDANSGGSDYGDSTVKLSTLGGLSVASYFTPADQLSLEGNDTDHGSGGAAILVDQPVGAPHQHLLIGGGKEGNMFLLDRDNLGGYGGNFTPNDSNAVQKFSVGNGIFSTAAFFNNALYVAPIGASLETFAFNTATGQFNTSRTSKSPGSFGFPGATPSVSATGTANAIVWAIDASAYGTPCCSNGPAILHAYDATNLATELWNSSQAAGNAAGNAVKFTVPTVANGRVYIGTRSEIDVYGLLP